MRVSSLLLIVVAFACSAVLAQESKTASPAETGAKPATRTREQLEKDFAERMSNATLVGHFTDRTREGGKLPREEKYTLGKVSKLEGDTWLFQARIQYGGHDVTLPLPLRVVWSGDTPVITLDKVAIPGFGTFTCRVMIFADQYAGMWDGANHGGLLFGKIVREEKDDKGAAPTKGNGEAKESDAAKK